jgi:hypothetical protein
MSAIRQLVAYLNGVPPPPPETLEEALQRVDALAKRRWWAIDDPARRLEAIQSLQRSIIGKPFEAAKRESKADLN